MTTREIIEARLHAPPKKPRRLITVRLKESQIERLEMLAKILTKQSGTRVSKNQLMEDAIEAFLEELQSEGLSLDQLAKEIDQL